MIFVPVITLIVVTGLIAVLIRIYLRLLALRRETDAAFVAIDIPLEERIDLIPHLVETVRRYSGHEDGPLDDVIAARAAATAADSVDERVHAENRLSETLRLMFEAARTHPELKSDETYLRLETQLNELEIRIAAARRAFNDAVSRFNAGIQIYPDVLVAAILGFTPRDGFDFGRELGTG